MKFILLSWVKFYTKEAIKTLKIVTIGSAIVLTVVFVKYKPAYEVTISGETIGFIGDRDLMESKIEKYIKDDSGNIAFREIEELPEYELKLINRDKKTSENEVMLAVQDLTITTYENFAVTTNGEVKIIVDSQEKAENIITEMKTDLLEGVDLDLGIIEIYETTNSAVEVEEAEKVLTEYKVAKVTEYQEKKAEEERIAKEEAEKNAKAQIKNYASATVATTGTVGSLNGMALSIPVNGSVSSRFGSRSGSRSTVHTGLDIAASSGTGIRPISVGTVVYSGYKGTYGNLIIIDHGNGVQSYYAHCSALYVSAGTSVSTDSVIGAVGSTGNSTGPHLHLEIRINGTPVNPQNYLYNN